MAIAENLDFLNQNSLRNFPLKEGLSALSLSDEFVIPESFLLDCSLAMSSNIDRTYYVSKVQNTPEIITVEISDDLDVVAGLFTITVDTHETYGEYFLAPSADYVGANGRLTVGDLRDISNLQTGIFHFEITSTELEMRCVVPSLNAINRMLFIDEKGLTHAMTGNVTIVARNNLKFRKSGDVIFLDAGDGLGLNKDCIDELPCIRTIRNVAGDDDGNFTFLGADCAQFSEMTTPPGLMLQETCCKPCMGCDEISELTERVMHLEVDLLRLKEYAQRTQEIIAQFSQTTSYNCEC